MVHQWSKRKNYQSAFSFCKLLPKYTIKEKVINKSIKKNVEFLLEFLVGILSEKYLLKNQLVNYKAKSYSKQVILVINLSPTLT